MDIMTHAKFHFNWLMLILIFGVWAPLGPGERLKRPGLIGLSLSEVPGGVKIISEKPNFNMLHSQQNLSCF